MKNFKSMMKKKLPYILHIVATFFAIGLCAWWIKEINASKFKGAEPFVMMIPIGVCILSVPITLIFGFIALFKKQEAYNLSFTLCAGQMFQTGSFVFAIVMLLNLPTFQENWLQLSFLLPMLCASVCGFLRYNKLSVGRKKYWWMRR